MIPIPLMIVAADVAHSALTWAGFYLICFVVGFILTLITFLAGTVQMHIPGHWHLHLGHHGHIQIHHGHAGGGGHVGGTEIPIVNTFTIMAFLAWFGGTGYLLTHYGRIEVLAGLPIAVVGGLVGAGFIFWFMLKLMKFEGSHTVPDGDVVGSIGTVTSPIREGGTGEVVFVHGKTRRVSGARSDDGTPIARGSEVVITRSEKGIAYVKPWDEFSGEIRLDEPASASADAATEPASSLRRNSQEEKQ